MRCIPGTKPWQRAYCALVLGYLFFIFTANPGQSRINTLLYFAVALYFEPYWK